MATKLPLLKEVERLSPQVVRILGGNPGKFTLQGTNTYLVGTGLSRILIDTGEGYPSWISALKDYLTTSKATITTALITHWHPDHTSGVHDLISICAGAKIHKNDPAPGQESIDDGQIFSTEGATLRAVHCPGHTVDHMAFMLEEEGAMFTGDNVLGHGTAVFEDLPAYLASLALMKGKFRVGETGRVYPGHGEYIDDGKAKIEEYITHREMREREILKALEGGKAKVDDVGSGDGTTKDGMTAMEVVKVVYRDVPEALHAPAEGGVKKILKKLEGEGKVRNCGRGGEWVVVKGGGKATL